MQIIHFHDRQIHTKNALKTKNSFLEAIDKAQLESTRLRLISPRYISLHASRYTSMHLTHWTLQGQKSSVTVTSSGKLVYFSIQCIASDWMREISRSRVNHKNVDVHHLPFFLSLISSAAKNKMHDISHHMNGRS